MRIANSYFIHDRAVLQVLIVAALSEVKIRVLVPEFWDSKMAKLNMSSRYEQLLEVSVKIYLHPNFSHGKMKVINREIL